jgi:hypothetical protein
MPGCGQQADHSPWTTLPGCPHDLRPSHTRHTHLWYKRHSYSNEQPPRFPGRFTLCSYHDEPNGRSEPMRIVFGLSRLHKYRPIDLLHIDNVGAPIRQRHESSVVTGARARSRPPQNTPPSKHSAPTRGRRPRGRRPGRNLHSRERSPTKPGPKGADGANMSIASSAA